VDIGREIHTAERLLVSTGRRTDLAALGVAAAGLDPGARTIATDGRMRAADGGMGHRRRDREGRPSRTCPLYAGPRHRGPGHPGARDGEPADYRAVPAGHLHRPGDRHRGRLTEEQARAAGLRVRTGVTQIPASARGWIHKAGNDGFIKVVADADRSVLVGASSAGPCGG